jgi:hypothetical protein
LSKHYTYDNHRDVSLGTDLTTIQNFTPMPEMPLPDIYLPRKLILHSHAHTMHHPLIIYKSTILAPDTVSKSNNDYVKLRKKLHYNLKKFNKKRLKKSSKSIGIGTRELLYSLIFRDINIHNKGDYYLRSKSVTKSNYSSLLDKISIFQLKFI